MAKFAAAAVLDGALDVVATATELYICEGQPTDRADAISKAAAPAITLDSGDYTKSSSGSNRVLTVSAQTVTANASRPVNHVALCTGSVLLYVTTCPSQTTNNGSLASVAAFTVTQDQPI